MDRWTDDRLDDRFAVIDARLARLDGVPDRLIRLEGTVTTIAQDAQECNENVRGIRKDWQDDKVRQVTERKTDRRWQFGAALSSAGLILSALAIYVGAT